MPGLEEWLSPRCSSPQGERSRDTEFGLRLAAADLSSSIDRDTIHGIMRRSSLALICAVVIGLAGSFVLASQAGQGGPPPQGRGGRGGGVQIQPGQECPPGMTMTRALLVIASN